MGPGYDAREALAEMFGHAPDAMFLVRASPDGRLLYQSVNPAWERATGVRASDAIGRSPDDLFSPAVAQQLNAYRRRCLEEAAPVTVEEDIDFPGGQRRWQTHLVPISGKPAGGLRARYQRAHPG